MNGENAYDSRRDTLKHIDKVSGNLHEMVRDLTDRSFTHDYSKLEPFEKEAFDRMTPKLAGLTYGTDEYKQSLADLGPALQHHYANNSHHPEHYENGVDGMTLMDVAEMLCDWKAAGERQNDGDLAKSIEINTKRFGLSPQLASILRNEALARGWITEPKS